MSIRESLSALLAAGLIVRCDEEAEPRFDMASDARNFARAQLEAHPWELEELCRAHACYFADWTERIEPALAGPMESVYRLMLGREWGNVRAALIWAHARHEVEPGLRLATALWRYWLTSGHVAEGQEHIEALLALSDTIQHHSTLAAGTLPSSLPASLRARALAVLGMLEAAQRDFTVAEAHLHAGLVLGQNADDWVAEAIGLVVLGFVRQIQGDLDDAVVFFEAGLAVGEAHHDAYTRYAALAGLARIASQRGNLRKAQRLFKESWAISREASHRYHDGLMLLFLGEIALRQRENLRALTLFRDAVATFSVVGAEWLQLDALELLAVAFARMERLEHAARLLGAAARLRGGVSAPFVSTEQARYSAIVAPVRLEMSEGPWAHAYAAGYSLTLVAVCAEALAVLDPEEQGSPHSRLPGSRPKELTAREREILLLLADGLSDPQIAQKLGISPRTVNHHVAAILDKLGVTSRAAAARRAVEHYLL